MGFNLFSLVFRLALAAFCFIAYYYTDNREINGDLLLLIGIVILVVSIMLFFITHLHTTVYGTKMVLTGAWSLRKVKIDLNNIITAVETDYSNYLFNNTAYNLHFKNIIRFYTYGRKAIKLIDRDQQEYLIGTQRGTELLKLINEIIPEKIISTFKIL
ncbi:MAG: hypothetical protein IPO27_01905 [Bacteroidetes bacterium]|nr:hypothetical protein [Bacteroidota bacterium]